MRGMERMVCCRPKRTHISRAGKNQGWPGGAGSCQFQLTAHRARSTTGAPSANPSRNPTTERNSGGKTETSFRARRARSTTGFPSANPISKPTTKRKSGGEAGPHAHATCQRRDGGCLGYGPASKLGSTRTEETGIATEVRRGANRGHKTPAGRLGQQPHHPQGGLRTCMPGHQPDGRWENGKRPHQIK